MSVMSALPALPPERFLPLLALILIAIMAAVANIGTETCQMYNNIALQGVKIPPP